MTPDDTNTALEERPKGLLSLNGIQKNYGSNIFLKDIYFSHIADEIHALVDEDETVDFAQRFVVWAHNISKELTKTDLGFMECTS